MPCARPVLPRTNEKSEVSDGFVVCCRVSAALWLGNDESLYDLACKYKTYDALREALVESYGLLQTRDGVEYDDPNLDIAELDELLEEF